MEKHHILGLFIIIIVAVFLFTNYTSSVPPIPPGISEKLKLCTDSDSTPIYLVNHTSYRIPGVVTARGVTYPDRCDSSDIKRTRMFEGLCDNGEYREINVSCSIFGPGEGARYRCLTVNASVYPNRLTAYCGAG